jgi:hypothetical protein
MTELTYAEQNQRETAEHVLSLFKANSKLSDALRALASYADWEADDPKSICLNVASYLEGGNRSRPYML